MEFLTTKCCCVLVFSMCISLSLTAVLPTTEKTAETTPAPSIDLFANNHMGHLKKECNEHKDCFCSMGIGLCHESLCFCVWSIMEQSAVDHLTDEQVLQLISGLGASPLPAQVDQPADTQPL